MNEMDQLISLLLKPLPEYVIIVKYHVTPNDMRTESCIVKKTEIKDFNDAIVASALIHNPVVVSRLEQFRKDVADLEADGHKWEIKGCKAVWEEDDRARFMAEA